MKMKKTIPALPGQDIKQSTEFYSTKLGLSAHIFSVVPALI
jgi:hypothetical protein